MQSRTQSPSKNEGGSGEYSTL